MKHFGKLFTELLYRSGYTQKAVGEKLGLSHVTVTRLKEQPSVDAATLESVCRLFRVPVTLFFDSDVQKAENTALSAAAQTAGVELEMLRAENRMLNQLVSEKERTIQILLKK